MSDASSAGASASDALTPISRTPRVGVRAAIVRGGAILMNRYAGEVHDLPGGGQEHGEAQIDALQRECREEIGAEIEVFGLACVFEVITDVAARSGRPIDLFHQVNLVFWCDLPEGQEPGLGAVPDGQQIGTAWLPIDELHLYDVRPPRLREWLQSDPSSRPTWLGTLVGPGR